MIKIQSLGPADVFAAILDRIIRADGGAGNFGQVRIHLRTPIADPAALASAWRRLGKSAWPLGARFHAGLRGMRLVMRAAPGLELEREGDLARAAARQLREGALHPLARLCLIDDARAPGLVFTWHHGLCDARGALGLLALLPELAAGAEFSEPWKTAGYRRTPGVPATAAGRGKQAQQAMALLRPHRLVELWRPLRAAGSSPSPANPAQPVAALSCALGIEATAALQLRQRQATGRLAETPFLLACVAAALEAELGIKGDVLMPLAVDLREPGERRLLANCHGYCFLRVPAGLASRDLIAAAQHLKQAHRDWLAADGLSKLASSMSWFAHVPQRLAQAQLGNFRAGVAASCLVANTGQTAIPASYFGAEVVGVDHAACIPGSPGIGVLFHRDARGLVYDVLACGRVITALPPARLAAALRWQLLERPLSTAIAR